MSTELLERLARIDPHPVDAEPPEGARDAAATLHVIEWRMDVDVQEMTTTPKAHQRRKKGALVAVAAFAAVVIVGVALALASGGGEVEPATTVPPTTPTTTTAPTTTLVVSADELSADDLALAEAFVDAMNSPDSEVWLSMFAEPVIAVPEFGAGWTIAADGEDLYGTLLAERSNLGACTPAGVRVSCRIYHSNLFTETIGLDPYWDVWSFVPDGGLVVDVRWTHDVGGRTRYQVALADFQVWVDEYHPEAGTLVADPGTLEDWVIGVSEDQLALLPERIAEYGDSLG